MPSRPRAELLASAKAFSIAGEVVHRALTAQLSSVALRFRPDFPRGRPIQ
jgi:hypothetical protein